MPYDFSPVSGSHDPKYKRSKEEWDKYMEPDDFKKILKTIKEQPANDLNRHRDYIMFAIMGNIGLRVAELIVLKKKHFNIFKTDPIRIHVPVAKKRKKNALKEVCVHEKVMNVVERYIKRLLLHDDDYLFESDSAKSGHITDRTVRNVFYHYVRHVGIKENLSPHSLRHMFGMRCYRYTKDPKWVQIQLAHSNMGGGISSVTSGYVHLSTDDKAKYVERVGYIL